MKFIPQYEPRMKLKYIWAVAKQMHTGWVGPGLVTEKFEQRLKEITGARHVISTTSGTTALMMAIASLDIPKDKTILFPAYTFLAGANAAKFMGYNVRLVDIREESLCMNPAAMNLDESVGAVIFVNHNSYTGGDVWETKYTCDDHKIPMIEDSSQALGHVGAGRVGHIGIFSFSVPKLVTTGQGGVVFTDEDKLAERCRQIRDQGDNWRKSKIHSHVGVNFKFDDIHAAYGLAQLNDLKRLLFLRSRVRRWYELEGIDNLTGDMMWMMIYRTKKASQIIEMLSRENIQAVQYYKPVHWNPPFLASHGTYPIAEKMYDELVYLPSSLTLKRSQVKRICDVIKKVEEKQ